MARISRMATKLHIIWRDFEKNFRLKGGQYRYVGFDLQERVETWAKKYPKDVRICLCDDAQHSSSCLVLIEHRTKTHYMGTTVVFLPQCSGDPPAEFFLYPNRAEQLLEALQAIRKAAKPIQEKELADRKKLLRTL
jgi:hypothetical protein